VLSKKPQLYLSQRKSKNVHPKTLGSGLPIFEAVSRGLHPLGKLLRNLNTTLKICSIKPQIVDALSVDILTLPRPCHSKTQLDYSTGRRQQQDLRAIRHMLKTVQRTHLGLNPAHGGMCDEMESMSDILPRCV
jgi:hypothetical protein